VDGAVIPTTVPTAAAKQITVLRRRMMLFYCSPGEPLPSGGQRLGIFTQKKMREADRAIKDIVN
jgi:hypothetical protein